MSEKTSSFGDAYQILIDKLQSWYEGLISYIPNTAAALTVFALFYIMASMVRRYGVRAFSKSFDTNVIAQLIATLLKITIIILGVFVALGLLGLQKTVMSLLAGVGIVGIAIGFAFQDLAENFIAGIIMGIRKPFQRGDLIETHDELGHVVSLNLRNTILVNFSGQRIIIPNKEVFQNKLINYSQTGERRIEIEVGITFESDISKASSTACQAIENQCSDWLLEDKPVEAFALELQASCVMLSIRYWIAYPGEKSYFAAIHDGVDAIVKAFEKESITIPYPIRTLQSREPLALELNKRDEEKSQSDD